MRMPSAALRRWCSQEPDCALNGRDVTAFFDDLVQRADQDPIPAPRCVELGYCRPTVTGEDIRFNMQGLILIKDPVPELGIQGWPGLASALVSADAGDASQFSTRTADDETFDGFAALAIECVDWDPAGDTFADLSAKQLLGRTVAPHTQGATQTWTILAGCMDWPVPVVNPPHLADVRGAATDSPGQRNTRPIDGLRVGARPPRSDRRQRAPHPRGRWTHLVFCAWSTPHP